MTGKNHNLDLVKINAFFIKFGQILTICSKDGRAQTNSDINEGS